MATSTTTQLGGKSPSTIESEGKGSVFWQTPRFLSNGKLQALPSDSLSVGNGNANERCGTIRWSKSNFWDSNQQKRLSTLR